MKITIQDCPDGEEEEIIIRCRKMDEQMLKTIYALKAGREKLTVSKDDKLFMVPPAEIYYFEAWITGCLPTWTGKCMRQSKSSTSLRSVLQTQIFSGRQNQRLSIW